MAGKGNFSDPWTLGLDIGIASVGWAALAENRILDLGVRCFDKAETAQDGEPLNLARRTARLTRRRLYRRAWRLTKLARLLRREGLIPDAGLFKQQPGFATAVWQLRVDALDRRLEPTDWARVIYHLCKHRGFHWVSKAEEVQAEVDTKGEGGRVKQGLSHTKALMHAKRYRTAAEMVLAEFPDSQRNKNGTYDKALSRILLDEELAKLFQAQRELQNPHASDHFEQLIRGSGNRKSGLFWEQKPALAGADLLKMLGKCTFEKSEFRAPKASFTAERHVWLTKLNNMRIIVDGVSRPLHDAERTAAQLLPYETEKFKYSSLRKAWVRAGLLVDGFRFGGLAYPSAKQADEDKAKDPEDQILVKLPAWHELRLALKHANLIDIWQQISVAALDGRPELLDSIAWVLSVYKDDAEVEAELRKLPLPEADRLIAELLKVRFDKFSNLSLKALRQIVPKMEQGMRYDDAVKAIPAYGHHSQRFGVGEGESLYLPPFYSRRDARGTLVIRDDIDVPRNPVVLRALNQARKVVNALIRRYGSPQAVHIEMARELSRPLKGHWSAAGKYIDGRRDIELLQKEYADRKDAARDKFEQCIHRKPKGAEFEKWQLYLEQHGKCAYSLDALDLGRVVDDPSYTQIDHALPYSRSYDDSKNNKVLVLSRENQAKGNRTAFEYLTSFPGGEQGDRWRRFVEWVNGNKSYRMAKRNRLLRKNYDAKEAKGFRDRNLNDTRYICRFFKNYIEQFLKLADGSEAKRCVVVNGQLTAFLRARWGLLKIREESDRHHALDAAVVAACSHGMVKALADYSRTKEIEFLREGMADPETGEIINPGAHERLAQKFPEPWAHFRHELESRLKKDDVDALRADMERLGTYTTDALACVKPLFVSRAPQRLNGGAAHKDTIYSKPRVDHKLKVEEKSKDGAKFVRLASPEEQRTMAVELIGVFETGDKGKKYRLTDERLKDVVGAERNAWMVHALSLWIAQRGDNPKTPGTIAYPKKPKRGDPENGPFTGPDIKTVKLNAGKLSGVEVRAGIAQNDSMLRVDVFRKEGKYHFVPIYVHHRVAGLPNRAIVASKNETDWTLIDESFEFLFSLHPNDLLRIHQKDKKPLLGYFRACHSGTGNVNIQLHDRAKLGERTVSLKEFRRSPQKAIPNDKLGLIEGVGAKTALSIEKFHVDVLGNIYPAPPEVRHGLA